MYLFRQMENHNTTKYAQLYNTLIHKFFDVLLTVHLRIVLVIDQLNAQIIVL